MDSFYANLLIHIANSQSYMEIADSLAATDREEMLKFMISARNSIDKAIVQAKNDAEVEAYIKMSSIQEGNKE